MTYSHGLGRGGRIELAEGKRKRGHCVGERVAVVAPLTLRSFNLKILAFPSVCVLVFYFTFEEIVVLGTVLKKNDFYNASDSITNGAQFVVNTNS
jgi:hypothetical protein